MKNTSTGEIQTSPPLPIYYLVLLILAGESIFILPFVLVRIYRPTVLDLFQINNLDLGLCFSLYGIVALISYFIGGRIADLFAPAKVMGVALIMTAMGGLYFAQYPGLSALKLLYAYWGATTILLFWAAMIKATRIWGGTTRQGKAFGFLDGGRGLVAAGFGSLGIIILTVIAGAGFEEASFISRQEDFRIVIYIFSGIVALMGIIIMLFLHLPQTDSVETENSATDFKVVLSILKMPVVGLMMIIILTGYSGYKVTDIYSLYAREVMLFDEIKAAGVGTLLLYIRPILGVMIGFLADRSKPSLWLTRSFVMMLIGSLLLASGWMDPSAVWFFYFSIIFTAIGVYGIRSLYFALMEEGKISPLITGTVVGIISVIGYTPDIYMGPLIGILLDNFPGEMGHRLVFGVLMLFSMIGWLACILFRRVSSKK